MDAALLDLYDTVARTHWRDFSDRIAAELAIDMSTLYRAYDLTRPERSVGAFEGPEGDMSSIVEAAGIEPTPALIEKLIEMERRFSETGIESLLADGAVPVDGLAARRPRGRLAGVLVPDVLRGRRRRP